MTAALTVARLLALPGVTDVLVNAPDSVWIDRGAGLERCAVALEDADAVRTLAVALAGQAGRRLDDAQPTVDARLEDGTRLHAVLPPVADGCAVISLRRVRAAPLTLAHLVEGGTVTAELARVLAEAVTACLPLVVSGGTGAGKSTLLATLLSQVDHRERIVLIEEAGELNPDHPHVVRLVERRPNVEGAGAVGLAQLVREALRMRPDRIVVGECRGAELREVLAAANTGHRGSLTTIHANTAAAVPARLEALGALAGLTPRQLALQAAAAFRIIVHVARTGAGRQVIEVGMLDVSGPVEGGAATPRHEPDLRVTSAWRRGQSGTIHYGPAWAALLGAVGMRS